MSICASASNDFDGLTYKSIKLPDGELQYKESITEEEFHADILHLRYALDRAYGAKGSIDDEIFAKVDERLKSLPYISEPKELCEKLGEVLSAFPDRHLKTRYKGSFCYMQPIERVNVGKNLNDSELPWKGIKTEDGVYTLAVSKFTPGKWPDFLEFAEEAMGKAKAIVIDLRGNGGGDDAIALQLAEKLAGQKVEPPYASDVKRNTPETLMIWGNKLNVIKKNSDDPLVIEQVDICINENAERLKLAVAGELDEFTTERMEDTGWEYDRSKGFQGPIYILQDKDCGSSGESAIDFFEYFPNVTKVGFNTRGMLHFGNLGVFALPSSSVQINMPTKANKYKDGRFIEFTGIVPDIVLKDGQGAIEHVLDLIRK